MIITELEYDKLLKESYVLKMEIEELEYITPIFLEISNFYFGKYGYGYGIKKTKPDRYFEIEKEYDFIFKRLKYIKEEFKEIESKIKEYEATQSSPEKKHHGVTITELKQSLEKAKKGCMCQIHSSSRCGEICYTGKIDFCRDCEKEILILKSKLEGYELAKKEIIEKIDIFPVGEVICKYNLHRNPKRFSDMINDIFKELKKFISSGNPNKKGCGKMYCAIEGCGRIDESHSAHCVKHNRSPHNICGENGLCFECNPNTTGERDG